MRLIVAALFVALGMALGIFVLSVAVPHGPTFLIAPAIVVWFFLLIFGVLMLFNRRAIRTKDYAQAIEELEREGLLEEKRFRAIRALQAEEFGDEGDHYFLELDNGAILFLSGQYLYGSDEPRTFPCTEFTVRRHKIKGYAIDIQCGGTTLEPERTRPFSLTEIQSDEFPSDGEVITGKTYEQLRTGHKSKA